MIFLLFTEANIFLLRCGNGRLLVGNLFCSRGIFTELSPAGVLSSDDKLLAASRSSCLQEPWRVLVQSDRTQQRRIYSFGNDGGVQSHLLPSRPDEPWSAHTLYTFSSTGEYLVEERAPTTRRYWLGDGSQPYKCEASRSSQQSLKTLCPRTGRRFELCDERRGLVYIFADAWSTQALQIFTVARASLADAVALSVSPDGRCLGIVGHVFIGSGMIYEIVEEKSSYDIPLQNGGIARHKYTQELDLDPSRNTRFSAAFSWFSDPLSGWLLINRYHVQTQPFDADTSWRCGIQDDTGLVRIFVPHEQVTTLVCISGLPQTAREEKCAPPSMAQWLQYRVDQKLLLLDLELTIFFSLLSTMIAFGSLCAAENDTFGMGKLFGRGASAIGHVYVAVIGRRLYLNHIKGWPNSSGRNRSIDLQEIPLCAAELSP